MKKLLAIVVVCLCVALLSFKVKKTGVWRQGDKRIKVLATVTMIRDIVEMIGGKNVDCITLIGPGIDPHNYEIAMGDRDKIQSADLVVANGLMLEHGANLVPFIREHKNALFLGDYFIEDHSQDLIYIDGQVDPHIWMDVNLWSNSINPLVKQLCAFDPEHRDEYLQRAELARQKLLAIDADITKKMLRIDEKKRYLITSHDAFFYFSRRYLANGDKKDWQERVKAPQGLNPQEEISLFQLDTICKHILKYDLHHIFFESNLSKQSLQRIVEVCKGRGQKVLLCSDPLYGDAIDDASGPVKNYEQMMLHNATLISSVLNQEVINDTGI